MEAYCENLAPIYMPRTRRANPEAPLDAKELRAFRAACGSLQWLVAQCASTWPSRFPRYRGT
eukprot:16205637-Heterocapsa_arctica.AAC.1